MNRTEQRTCPPVDSDPLQLWGVEAQDEFAEWAVEHASELLAADRAALKEQE